MLCTGPHMQTRAFCADVAEPETAAAHGKPLAPPSAMVGRAPPAARRYCAAVLSCWPVPAGPPLRLPPLLFLAGPWSSTVPATAAPASPGPIFGMLLRRDLVELERLPCVAALCRSATGLAGPRPLSSSWRRPSLAPGRMA